MVTSQLRLDELSLGRDGCFLLRNALASRDLLRLAENVHPVPRVSGRSIG